MAIYSITKGTSHGLACSPGYPWRECFSGVSTNHDYATISQCILYGVWVKKLLTTQHITKYNHVPNQPGWYFRSWTSDARTIACVKVCVTSSVSTRKFSQPTVTWRDLGDRPMQLSKMAPASSRFCSTDNFLYPRYVLALILKPNRKLNLRGRNETLALISKGWGLYVS